MVQLNAYILDLDFDESDIEFQFIEYGSRSEARRIENYAVLDQESQAFQLRNIDLESKKSFYVVSFKEEDSELKILPSVTQLNANFPNPFNPITTISFDLAADSIVSIDIFNIRGQRVKTVTNEHFGAGSHNVEWNGTDENGRSVGSGIYFYRMVSGDFTDVKRMVLLK